MITRVASAQSALSSHCCRGCRGMAISREPFHGFDGTTHHEFKWHFGATPPKRNENGNSGWAEILSRSCDTEPDYKIIRVHACAFNPCCGVYRDSSYPQGPPMHVQPTDWRPSVSAAVAAGADGCAPPHPPPVPPPLVGGAALLPPSEPAHAAVAAAVGADAAAPLPPGDAVASPVPPPVPVPPAPPPPVPIHLGGRKQG